VTSLVVSQIKHTWFSDLSKQILNRCMWSDDDNWAMTTEPV